MPPLTIFNRGGYRFGRVADSPARGLAGPRAGRPTAPLAVALARGYRPGRSTGVTPVSPAPAGAPPESPFHDLGA
jgi:hypothetical protein